MYISGMDLGQRISNVAAKTGVKKHEELELNKLYPIIQASRSLYFTSAVNLILNTA
jgi:hypothetical protein